MGRVLLSMAVLVGCGGGSEEKPRTDVERPDVEAADFVVGIDNPYFPLPVGATWTLEADGEDGFEHIEVVVTDQVRTIQGVEATVVRDTVTIDGTLHEDTNDWYAQDSDGNVWYLGEETCEYENDECVNTEGSWEWGQDGALPGIIMPGSPSIAMGAYYQEWYPGHAEDAGELVEEGLDVTVAAGDFSDCIKTHDFSTLDLELDEFKYFCPGVGNVLVEEPDIREELTSYTIP